MFFLIVRIKCYIVNVNCYYYYYLMLVEVDGLLMWIRENSFMVRRIKWESLGVEVLGKDWVCRW